MPNRCDKDQSSETNKSVSLSPLKLKEALAGLLAVKPPPEESPGKRKRKRSVGPKRNKPGR